MSDSKEIKVLHRQAMERTDLALAARQRGDVDTQASLFREAYELESKAASLANDLPEPTRSVLLRSAASLALDCDLFVEAEKLICTALAGAPPAEIADELRDSLEQVNFKRHLRLRGITLHGDEVQMSIAGSAIGYGIAPIEAFLERVQKTETLLYRTAERKQQRPYRDRGRRDKGLRESFELYMTAPRAASFAVTFKVGRNDQLKLFGASMAEEVIDELFECLEIFTRNDEQQLRQRINEEAYFRNFVALAKGIAPDGRGVELVGFTTLRAGQLKEVALRAKRESELSPTAELMSITESGEPVTVSGILKRADSLKEGKNEIIIVDVTGFRHAIIVPPGMMSDIVRPLWETDVVVTGTRRGRKISLQDIKALNTDEQEPQ